MAADVRRLPAGDCRFFECGRCLREERVNPGYHGEWRCAVLRGWEEAYDEFLDRAEAFSLGPADVSRMWRGRLELQVERAALCPDFVRGEGGNGTGCACEFEALCLLRLPRCPGMCRRYERRVGR
ncbi:hypothetical protein [Desulfocurvus sp. DL9XJH121]